MAPVCLLPLEDATGEGVLVLALGFFRNPKNSTTILVGLRSIFFNNMNVNLNVLNAVVQRKSVKLSRYSQANLLIIIFWATSHANDKLAYNDNAIYRFVENIQF